MHSSRLSTIRCSGRLGGRGDCVCPWRGCLPGGVCVGGGVCLGDVCLGGVHLPFPPTLDRMTDACENITFPQLLLRRVKTKVLVIYEEVSWQLCITERLECTARSDAHQLYHSERSQPRRFMYLSSYLFWLDFEIHEPTWLYAYM